jgi:hypothetical protein
MDVISFYLTSAFREGEYVEFQAFDANHNLLDQTTIPNISETPTLVNLDWTNVYSILVNPYGGSDETQRRRVQTTMATWCSTI